MGKKQNIKWWWNIPIVLLIGILVPLGVRSVITDDNRFGWGTFSKQVAFRVNYYWVNDNGKKLKYNPGKELRGKVRKKLKKRGSTRYSDGALKSWIGNYTRYMYLQNKPGEEIVSFNAELLYKINTVNAEFRSGEKPQKILITYPSMTKD